MMRKEENITQITNHVNKITKNIKDSNYNHQSLPTVIQDQQYLPPHEQQQLEFMLTKHDELFKGGKGEWKGLQIQLEIKNDSKPCTRIPYRIPMDYQQSTKDTLNHLIKVGLLTQSRSSEWADPTFIVPK